jgi:hypothetical protein
MSKRIGRMSVCQNSTGWIQIVLVTPDGEPGHRVRAQSPRGEPGIVHPKKIVSLAPAEGGTPPTHSQPLEAVKKLEPVILSVAKNLTLGMTWSG